MTVEVLDPTLGPEFLQEIFDEAVDELRDEARMYLRSMYPKGYAGWQKPETNKILRLVDIMLKHDKLLEIAADPNQLPGDRQRAQMEIMEGERLRQEIMDGEE